MPQMSSGCLSLNAFESSGECWTEKRAKEMKADFNSYSVKQREYEERMIRQLEDDCKGDDDDNDDDDAEVDGKKQMLPLKVANKGKSKITGTVKQSTISSWKHKENATLGTYFIPRSTHSAQKSLQSCWKNEEVIERCDLAITKWMIDAYVSFNAANSIYYQHAINGITAIVPGYKRPIFHALRGYYLAKVIDEVKIFVESYRETWRKTGCTLMVDGWTDQKRRTLINFLVYCPEGTIFFFK